jgi:hypothetical protein
MGSRDAYREYGRSRQDRHFLHNEFSSMPSPIATFYQCGIVERVPGPEF